MKYKQAVSGAMRFAKEHGETVIVYGIKRRWWFGYSYHWGDEKCISWELTYLKRPVIRFMIITSGGRCV